MEDRKTEHVARRTRAGPEESHPAKPGRSDDIARKLTAAEQRHLDGGTGKPGHSTLRTSATARKLRRAQGIPEPSAPPPPTDERKALERTERENRRRAGGSGYREALIRIGLGNVDNATLLIFGFSVLTMLILPLIVILNS